MKTMIGMRLDPELLERIEDAANEDRRSRADMVRIILEDWLKDREAKKQEASA